MGFGVGSRGFRVFRLFLGSSSRYGGLVFLGNGFAVYGLVFLIKGIGFTSAAPPGQTLRSRESFAELSLLRHRR